MTNDKRDRAAIRRDELHKNGFNHPCKETCSGWQQGHDRGYDQAIKDMQDAAGNLEFDYENAKSEADKWAQDMFPMSFHVSERKDSAFVGISMARYQFNQDKIALAAMKEEISRLRAALDQSLRQWRYYKGQSSESNLDDDSAESKMYREYEALAGQNECICGEINARNCPVHQKGEG